MTEQTEAISDIVIMEKEPRKKQKIVGTQVCRIKWMRADVKRNLAAVSRFLIKNPEAKIVDIQKATWLSPTAIARARSNMAEYVEKDDRIMAITERDLEIVWKGQEEMNRRFNSPEEMKKIRTSDLASAMEKSEKRYMLFRWDATNKEGGLKVIDNINIV